MTSDTNTNQQDESTFGIFDVTLSVGLGGSLHANVQVEAENESQARSLAYAILNAKGTEALAKTFNTEWETYNQDCYPLCETRLGGCELKRLSPSTAEKIILNGDEISDTGCPDLSLMDLEEMPRKLALTLARHAGTISLSPEMEKEFKRHVTLTAKEIRAVIDFDDPDSQDGGERFIVPKDLETDFYWYIEDEAAELLAQCEYADLINLREISEKSAEAFGCSDFAELHLGSLTTLSDEAACWIAKVPHLQMDPFQELPKSAARIMKAKYKIQEEAYWSDPDEGVSSGYGTICNIEAGQETVIYMIYHCDGYMVEVPESELTPYKPNSPEENEAERTKE